MAIEYFVRSLMRWVMSNFIYQPNKSLSEIRERALVERLKDRDYRNEYLLDAIEMGDTVYLYSAVYWSCYALGIGKVAEAVGVSRKQVSRLRETGKDLPYDRIEKVLNVLGVYIRLSSKPE